MSAEVRLNYPSKPLQPQEVLAVKAETFPEEVYIAVNGLIAERLSGQIATFTIKALKSRIVELGLDKAEIEERGWHKVGAIYKQAGWNVHLHYPSEDDRDFDPYYSFDSQGPRSW
jgi:hypothetical protein